MLAITVGDLRLFLHVLGASVWVAGQILLATLVPTLRRMGHDAVTTVARAASPILWAGFGLAVATGLWNIWAVDAGSQSHAYQTTLAVKIGVVALSGVAAFVHTRARSPRARGFWGALAGLTALAALLLGVVLAG